jgi:hypothetical protein
MASGVQGHLCRNGCSCSWTLAVVLYMPIAEADRRAMPIAELGGTYVQRAAEPDLQLTCALESPCQERQLNSALRLYLFLVHRSCPGV